MLDLQEVGAKEIIHWILVHFFVIEHIVTIDGPLAGKPHVELLVENSILVEIDVELQVQLTIYRSMIFGACSSWKGELAGMNSSSRQTKKLFNWIAEFIECSSNFNIVTLYFANTKKPLEDYE